MTIKEAQDIIEKDGYNNEGLYQKAIKVVSEAFMDVWSGDNAGKV